MHFFPHLFWRKEDGFWSFGIDGFFSACICFPTVSDVRQTVFDQSGVMGLFMDAFFPPPYLTHDGRFFKNLKRVVYYSFRQIIWACVSNCVFLLVAVVVCGSCTENSDTPWCIRREVFMTCCVSKYGIVLLETWYFVSDICRKHLLWEHGVLREWLMMWRSVSPSYQACALCLSRIKALL